MTAPLRTAAQLLVACLENEGVEVVFGLPGEENLHVIDAIADSSIRFVTTRDERGAAFMADTYGALTGRAGVCLATLGPGALNLVLGIANAQLDSHPLVAIMAQAGLDRIYKESHQVVDLVAVYRPLTKWGDMVTLRDAAPEMVRKAFKQAQTERPGATFIVLPEDVAERETDGASAPGQRATRSGALGGPGPPRRPRRSPRRSGRSCSPGPASRATARWTRCDGSPSACGSPSRRRSRARACSPTTIPNALGTIGFMVKDYANFGFDRADLVVAVGYDLVEYAPSRWNPAGDKPIIHVHRTVAEVDALVRARGRAAGVDRRVARRAHRVWGRRVRPGGRPAREGAAAQRARARGATTTPSRSRRRAS